MPDSETAWAFLRNSDLITSATEVQAAVDRVAAEIEGVLGKRYDCGSKLGYLQATVEFGLRHPETGREFERYLKSR